MVNFTQIICSVLNTRIITSLHVTTFVLNRPYHFTRYIRYLVSNAFDHTSARIRTALSLFPKRYRCGAAPLRMCGPTLTLKLNSHHRWQRSEAPAAKRRAVCAKIYAAF